MTLNRLIATSNHAPCCSTDANIDILLERTHRQEAPPTSMAAADADATFNLVLETRGAVAAFARSIGDDPAVAQLQAAGEALRHMGWLHGGTRCVAAAAEMVLALGNEPLARQMGAAVEALDRWLDRLPKRQPGAPIASPFDDVQMMLELGRQIDARTPYKGHATTVPVVNFRRAVALCVFQEEAKQTAADQAQQGGKQALDRRNKRFREIARSADLAEKLRAVPEAQRASAQQPPSDKCWHDLHADFVKTGTVRSAQKRGAPTLPVRRQRDALFAFLFHGVNINENKVVPAAAADKAEKVDAAAEDSDDDVVCTGEKKGAPRAKPDRSTKPCPARRNVVEISDDE